MYVRGEGECRGVGLLEDAGEGGKEHSYLELLGVREGIPCLYNKTAYPGFCHLTTLHSLSTPSKPPPVPLFRSATGLLPRRLSTLAPPASPPFHPPSSCSPRRSATAWSASVWCVRRWPPPPSPAATSRASSRRSSTASPSRATSSTRCCARWRPPSCLGSRSRRQSTSARGSSLARCEEVWGVGGRELFRTEPGPFMCI